MLKIALFMTTALVMCTSTSFANEKPGAQANANSQFVTWYGGSPSGAKHRLVPLDGSRVLYAQSASSGFSSYAVSATNFTSTGFCCFGNIAADDFIIPGTDTHKVTAVYAAGVFSGQHYTQSWTLLRQAQVQ